MNIAELNLTCGACPVQLEGHTDDGRHIYARSRGSRVRVTVAHDKETAILGAVEDGPKAFEVEADFTAAGPFREVTGAQLRALVRLFVSMIAEVER